MPLIRLQVLLALLVTGVAHADGTIKVLVKLSPAGSFTAKSERLKGTVIKDGGNFVSEKLTVSIDSLKTGIRLRDEHFWKYLKHPSIQKITLTDLKASAGKGSAVLEVNGVKKPVEISFSESGNQVSASFKASAREFNLPPEKYLGISVLDEVNIEAQVDYSKK
ncbi:MAG: YceI family protein [Bdellovibrionales bacterium]|nr:YceI family protein [Bdellovibrionales bacterium]